MATRITVKCKNCDNYFYIFEDFFKADADICCPYCYSVLPKEYNRYVLNAYKAVKELNYTVRSRSEDDRCDLFEFSFEELFVPEEKFKGSQSE